MAIRKKTVIFAYGANFIMTGSGFIVLEGWKGLPKAFSWLIPFIVVNVWRAEIGAIWAILIMAGSYIHLFKTIPRKIISNGEARSLSSLSTDQFEKLTQLVMTVTAIQLNLCKEHSNSNKLRDDWSLGYVYGALDTWLQLTSIEASQETTIFTKLVFSKTFGDEYGEDLFNKSTILAAMRVPDSLFVAGSRHAHDDILESVRTSEPLRLSWAKYLAA